MTTQEFVKWFSKVDGIPCRVINCEEIPDVFIENRVPGKTIFVNDGKPVVVCGTGLVRILELKNAETMDDMLPIKKFRLRFE
jgi:methionyl-tRNA formyltransferase